MDNTTQKSSSSLPLVLLIIVILGFFGFGFFLQSKPASPAPTLPTNEGNIAPSITLLDYITYKGEVGKDALIILKEHAKISQDASGLVSSINGRAADAASREYWAFYVNGKMSQVGPADYQTTNSDVIEWKIEKY